MSTILHQRLAHELDELGLSPEEPPSPERWRAFLAAVARGYQTNDEARAAERGQLAVSLAIHEAILAGHSARFLTAADLILDLTRQETARALQHRLRSYLRPTLLAIDEVGYLAYDAHAADLLFQVVSRRYEQKSIVITTNLPFKQWDTVFPNAACAVALIDRLTHHAEIISIDGESYRKREAEQAQKRKQEQKPKR